MPGIQQTPMPENKEQRQRKGLYAGTNGSVKTLNVVIIVCVLAILAFAALSLRDPGLLITFDTMGGTDIAPQKQMYGEALALPDPPTREGYVFAGWYKDYACYELWNVDIDFIQSEMTLYAGWEKVK